MQPATFKEIMEASMELLVERSAVNPTLQMVVNSFLLESQTSPVFAAVLLNFLIERMDQLGCGPVPQQGSGAGADLPAASPSGVAESGGEQFATARQPLSVERASLYLRLFKLVFGSVSFHPADIEQMLQPHLHQIVKK